MPETSQLICYAIQLTGFYIKATVAFNGLIKIFCDSCFTYCYYIEKCFSSTQEMLTVIKVFIKKIYTYIEYLLTAIYFCEVFQYYAFSQCHII